MTNIFQRGWNHQPGIVCSILILLFSLRYVFTEILPAPGLPGYQDIQDIQDHIEGTEKIETITRFNLRRPGLVMTNSLLWKITIFHGTKHYRLWFSMAMSNYQRVFKAGSYRSFLWWVSDRYLQMFWYTHNHIDRLIDREINKTD